MKIINEHEDPKTGDWLFDVEYSQDELKIFKEYCEVKGKDVEKMIDDEILQFAIEGILKEQMEREENEKNGTSKTDKD